MFLDRPVCTDLSPVGFWRSGSCQIRTNLHTSESSTPIVRYYYNDQSNQVAGPVEEDFLYQACRTGSLSAQTMVVPEGGDVWMPLDEVLPFFFSYRESVLGPLTLKQIRAFAAQAPDPVLVTEPGGSDWRPLPASVNTSLVPPPLPTGRVAAPAAMPAVSPVRRKGRAPAGLPGGVVAAGVIWIAYGGFRLVSTALLFVRVLGQQSDLLAVAFVVCLVAAVVPLLLSFVFLNIGLKSIQGTITNLRANGFASIGIAVLLSLMQFMIPSGFDDTLALVNFGLNFLLVLAGLMAISENNRLLDWQNARKSRISRGRPVR